MAWSFENLARNWQWQQNPNAMAAQERDAQRQEAAAEKAKEEAQQAQAFRKALSLVDPDNKDIYTAMGGPDLKGAWMAHGVQAAMAEAQQKQAQAAQRQQAIADAMQSATTTRTQPGAPLQMLDGGRVGIPLMLPELPATSETQIDPRALVAGLAQRGVLPVDQPSGLSAVLKAMSPEGQGMRPSVMEGMTKAGTPYVTYGNQFSFDPAATAEQRRQNEIAVATERERLRSQRNTELSAEDLLKSYQKDLEGLNKDWSLPPEERALKRREIEGRIEGLRGKTTATGGPSPTDISYLRANPGKRDLFEKRFGAGSAAKYLK